MERRTAGLILYDEYAMPGLGAYIRGRRPDFSEVEHALHESGLTGLPFEATSLANDLKASYMIRPTLDPIAYWLMNNPRLMYLTSMAGIKGYPHNNPEPMFADDFLVPQWPDDPHDTFWEEFEGRYPEDGKLTKRRDYSWMDDEYHHSESLRGQFVDKIRPMLTNYVGPRFLGRLDEKGSVLPDLRPARRRYVSELRNEPGRYVPRTLYREDGLPYDEDERLKLVEVLKELLEGFRGSDDKSHLNDFGVGAAVDILKKDYADTHAKHGELLTWILRHSIYLRAFVDVVPDSPAAYYPESADAKSLPQVPSKSAAEEGWIYLDGREWPVVQQVEMGLAKCLGLLPFARIADIRQKKAHSDYRARLEKSREIADPGQRAVEEARALADLLRQIQDILYRETKDDIFHKSVKWEVGKFVLDHRGYVFTLVQKTAERVLPELEIPITILCENIREKVDKRVTKLMGWMEQESGRELMIAVAKLADQS